MQNLPIIASKSELASCLIIRRTHLSFENHRTGVPSRSSRCASSFVFAMLCIVWFASGCGGYVVHSASGAAHLAVSGTILAFGAVPLNTNSTKPLTLTASGAQALTITSVSLAGAGFAVSGPPFPMTMQAGQPITLQVVFHPTESGDVSGAMTIVTDSLNGPPIKVALSGTGSASTSPGLTVSANSLAFGNVTVNTTSTQTLALVSSGTQAVTVNSITMFGASFSETVPTLPAVLNPGQTLNVQVSFDPTVTGAASGTLSISSNSASGSTTIVTLSGSGTASATPQLTLSASTFAFGNVALNTISSRTLTLTSSGTAALKVNSASISGAAFTVSGGSFPATLNPGQSMTLRVGFDPKSAGPASGTLTIASNSSSGNSSTVSLSGTGIFSGSPQLTVSPGTLSFGNVLLNTNSSLSLTLMSSGTSAVTVNSVALTGAEFTSTAALLPATLNPGQSLTLQFGFAPTKAGAASGTITIFSNSSIGATNFVTLTGTGINSTNPILTLSATTLNFGADPIGTAAALKLTLSSTGTSSVTVSSASVKGAGFSFSGITIPVTLNPNVAISIQVQFDPATAGAASGTLTFASNSSTGSTSVVALAGTGRAPVQHQVTLNWAAPAKSPVAVTGYNVYRASGTPTAFQRLNTSPIPQTTYIDRAVTSTNSYSYYVTSVDAGGVESVPSSAVTVTIP